jgi:hypothetical protein
VVSGGIGFAGAALMFFLVPETLHRTSRLYVAPPPAAEQPEVARKPG